MIKIAVMAMATLIAVLLGRWRGAAVIRCDAQITLERVHQRLPEVLVLFPICILFTVLTVVIFMCYQILWFLPVALDPWALPIVYVCSTGFLAYLLSLAILVAYRQAHRERHKLALAAGILLCAFGSYYLRHSLPVYPRLRDVKTSDNVILQTSLFSCAPACAANVLALMGKPATEREMARLAGTTDLGTAPGGIIQSLRLKGVAARKARLTIAELRRMTAPVILLVDCLT
jgi:hypothetical protein